MRRYGHPLLMQESCPILYNLQRSGFADGEGGVEKQRPWISFIRIGPLQNNPREWAPSARYDQKMKPTDQLELKMLPPRMNIASAEKYFIESIKSVVGYGFDALNYHINVDMMEEGHALMSQEDRSCFDDTDTGTAATKISEDEYSDSDSEYGSDDNSVQDGDDTITSDFEDEGESDKKVAADPVRVLL